MYKIVIDRMNNPFVPRITMNLSLNEEETAMMRELAPAYSLPWAALLRLAVRDLHSKLKAGEKLPIPPDFIHRSPRSHP